MYNNNMQREELWLQAVGVVGIYVGDSCIKKTQTVAAFTRSCRPHNCDLAAGPRLAAWQDEFSGDNHESLENPAAPQGN